MVLALLTASLYAQTRADVNLGPLEKLIEKQRNLHSLYVEFEQERKLRALRKPISASGKIWMAKEGKLFRMQTGEPPHSIVLKNGNGNTTIINTKKKTAEIVGPNRKFGSRSDKMGEMIQHLFPRSMDDLQKNFHILSVEKAGENWEAVLEPIEPEIARYLRQFILRISKSGDTLAGFSLLLKDQSVITSRTTRSLKNPNIPAEVFSPVLSGYKIKK